VRPRPIPAFGSGDAFGWQAAVNVNVDARGASKEDADEIAKRTARAVPNALAKAARQATMRPAGAS
jgi:hypothetical protein